MNMATADAGSSARSRAERFNIPGRFERLPMASYQRKLFGVIASAWLVDQIDVALLTFLLGSIVVEFGLTPAQTGLLAAMTFAGQLVGNVAAGTASDRYGRKAVFQVTMVVWGAGFAPAFGRIGAGGFLLAAGLVLVLGVETRGRALEAISH